MSESVPSASAIGLAGVSPSVAASGLSDAVSSVLVDTACTSCAEKIVVAPVTLRSAELRRALATLGNETVWSAEEVSAFVDVWDTLMPTSGSDVIIGRTAFKFVSPPPTGAALRFCLFVSRNLEDVVINPASDSDEDTVPAALRPWLNKDTISDALKHVHLDPRELWYPCFRCMNAALLCPDGTWVDERLSMWFQIVDTPNPLVLCAQLVV